MVAVVKGDARNARQDADKIELKRRAGGHANGEIVPQLGLAADRPIRPVEPFVFRSFMD